MDDPECYFNSLPKELEVKRDRMVHLLESVGLKPIVPDGGYFIIADVSLLDVDLFDMKDSNETYDYKFVKWMIKNKKLSAIPVSAFCNAETKLQFEKFVRFCFIKVSSLFYTFIMSFLSVYKAPFFFLLLGMMHSYAVFKFWLATIKLSKQNSALFEAEFIGL